MSNTTQQPPPEQIQAYQDQWNATKAMFQAEIDFMIKTVTDKQNEFNSMKTNPQEWGSMSLQERFNLRNQVTLAQTELQQILQELNYAKQDFIDDNPQAEHYVQF